VTDNATVVCTVFMAILNAVYMFIPCRLDLTPRLTARTKYSGYINEAGAEMNLGVLAPRS
jgi:hypothetical protein